MKQTGTGASKQPVIEIAAGGLVWDQPGPPRRLAIVHRTVHGDWTLPKGKLEADETPQAAALREVKEELGVRAQLGCVAGISWYPKNGRPKLVIYWHMLKSGDSTFTPNAEVDRVEWLPPARALELLSYESDRKVVREQADCPWHECS